jgi:site-specific recombinase XerC
MRIERVVEEYVNEKKHGDESKQAIANYRHRLQPFLDFCEKYGFTHARDLNARRVKQYKKERVNEDALSPVTLGQQMRTLRDFLSWSEDNAPTPNGLAEHAVVSPDYPIGLSYLQR